VSKLRTKAGNQQGRTFKTILRSKKDCPRSTPWVFEKNEHWGNVKKCRLLQRTKELNEAPRYASLRQTIQLIIKMTEKAILWKGDGTAKKKCEAALQEKQGGILPLSQTKRIRFEKKKTPESRSSNAANRGRTQTNRQEKEKAIWRCESRRKKNKNLLTTRGIC